MTTRFEVGSATDVGQLRSVNEDSKLVGGEVTVYAVADGMGGHQGGNVASAIAVETLEATLVESSTDAVVEAVREANRRIHSRAADTPELRGMGTTLVAIALVNPGGDDEEVAWVNVGDSRAYLLRNRVLEQLSRDHSLVEDLRRGGQLTDDEAAVHPQRNIVTRALGIDPDVEVDLGAVIPLAGDRFLLCSDGLTNEVDLTTLKATLESVEDPDAAAGELVRLANEGGGRDNITCVVADVVDDGGRAARRATVAGAAARAATGDGEADRASDDPTTVDVTDGPADDRGDADLDITEVTPALTTPGAAPPDPAATDVVPAVPTARAAGGLELDAPASVDDGAAPGPAGATARPDPDLDATPPAGTPVVSPPRLPPEEEQPPLMRATAESASPTGAAAGSAASTGALPPFSPTAADETLPFGRETPDLYRDMDEVRGRRRVVTVLVTLALLGGVALGGYVGLSWYANRTWFVSTAGTEVVVYRGQPGGFLFFDPTVEHRSDHELEDYRASDQEAIEAERTFGSESDARSFMNRLTSRADQAAETDPTPTSTSSSTTTSTTTTTSRGSTTGSSTTAARGEGDGGTVNAPAERSTTTEGR